MTRAIAGIAAVALALAACSVTPDEPTAGERVGASAVAPVADAGASDAELAALAAGTGIEPCPEGVAAPDAAVPGLPGDALPCLDGSGPVDLSALRGTPLVVNVWASWCAPCRAEMPVLRDAARDWGDDVRVLGIAINDDPVRSLALLEELGVTFPSVVDREAVTRSALAYPGPPVTYFVRPDGTIAGRHDGAILARAQLDALVAEYLGA